MNRRKWFLLVILAGCMTGLASFGMLAGTETLARDPATAPTLDHYLYLPLVVKNYHVQHRHGDWVVTGSESVENATIDLEGDLLIRPTGSLTLTNVTLLIEQKPQDVYQILAESGSSLVISRSAIAPARLGDHLAFVVQGARFALLQSRLEGLSDRSGRPYSGGLLLNGVAGAILDGNTINHGEWFGVWLTDSLSTTITNNTITCTGPDGTSGAIYLENSHNNTITYNHLYRQWDALHLESSWNNYIAYNELTLTDHTIGISIWHASGNNVVAYNHISAYEGRDGV